MKQLIHLDIPPSIFKFIGASLALLSGLFIGTALVFKRKAILESEAKNEKSGQGHAYLKLKSWWFGMSLLFLGELFNFAAYAFAPAILVTPLGAISVLVSAILSSFVLKERLNFYGKIGCALCLIGATDVVLHAPPQSSVSDIYQFGNLIVQPGFLAYSGFVALSALILIVFISPKLGQKNILVYLSICSLIGSLSVIAIQGIGASIIYSIQVSNQFKFKLVYGVLLFAVTTLLTQLNYLNKALSLFSTAEVTPIYYVLFTTFTLIASCIFYQGFESSAFSIIASVLGFSVLCCGVILLQFSKINDKVTSQFHDSFDGIWLSKLKDPNLNPNLPRVKRASPTCSVETLNLQAVLDSTFSANVNLSPDSSANAKSIEINSPASKQRKVFPYRSDLTERIVRDSLPEQFHQRPLPPPEYIDSDPYLPNILSNFNVLRITQTETKKSDAHPP